MKIFKGMNYKLYQTLTLLWFGTHTHTHINKSIHSLLRYCIVVNKSWQNQTMSEAQDRNPEPHKILRWVWRHRRAGTDWLTVTEVAVDEPRVSVRQGLTSGDLISVTRRPATNYSPVLVLHTHSHSPSHHPPPLLVHMRCPESSLAKTRTLLQLSSLGWVSEWGSEWGSEWASQWVSECVRAWASERSIEPANEGVPHCSTNHHLILALCMLLQSVLLSVYLLPPGAAAFLRF